MADTEKREEAENALLDIIIKGANDPRGIAPAAVHAYAEAYAWVRSPHQSHGGGTKPSKD